MHNHSSGTRRHWSSTAALVRSWLNCCQLLRSVLGPEADIEATKQICPCFVRAQRRYGLTLFSNRHAWLIWVGGPDLREGNRASFAISTQSIDCMLRSDIPRCEYLFIRRCCTTISVETPPEQRKSTIRDDFHLRRVSSSTPRRLVSAAITSGGCFRCTCGLERTWGGACSCALRACLPPSRL
jgi:hypothetical protein